MFVLIYGEFHIIQDFTISQGVKDCDVFVHNTCEVSVLLTLQKPRKNQSDPKVTRADRPKVT